MLPTPRRSFWLSRALLIGVLRPRNNLRNGSSSISRGSMPVVSNASAVTTLSRPKRRGSTKRSSLPDFSLRMAWVCFSTSDCGSQTWRRPVMPRWTIHWAVLSPTPCSFDFDLFADAGFRATPFLSRLKTMCLPIRPIALIRLYSRACAIAPAGDFSGSFFEPSQTDSITSPVTRLARPRAMVSTSGSSGIFFVRQSKSNLLQRTVLTPRLISRFLLFQERALLEITEGLLEFVLRVHDDRSVPGYRLFQRLAGYQQKTDSIFAGVDSYFVTTIEQNQRAIIGFGGRMRVSPAYALSWNR